MTRKLGVLVTLAFTACAQASPTIDDLVGCYEVEMGEWQSLYSPFPLSQVQDIFFIPPHIKLTDVDGAIGKVVEPELRERGRNGWWNEQGKVRIRFPANMWSTNIVAVWQNGTIQGQVEAVIDMPPPGTVAKADVVLRPMPCEAALLLESACDMFNLDLNDCVIRAYYDRCNVIDFCVLRCIAANDGDPLVENGCFESCNDKYSGAFEKPLTLASCSG